MFMHHVVMTKAFDPGVGAIDQAFQRAGLRQIASGDSWRLGSGDGLVLCQLMPINGQEACHIITVAASENQQAMGSPTRSPGSSRGLSSSTTMVDDLG
jgi:hypothetical protein